MEKEKTERGFSVIKFKDRYDSECSLQKSSLAFENCVWFGVDDADPQIMAKETLEGGDGWVKYDIPENVMLTTRMHLSRKMVLKLLPNLIKFVIIGKI